MDSYGTAPDGSERTAEEWRAAVAEKVLGCPIEGRTAGGHAYWEHDDTHWTDLTFRPDRSADDDRLALPVVRGWPVKKRDLWRRGLDHIRNGTTGRAGEEEFYLRGDWSAAALAVVEDRERRGPLVRIHIDATTTEAPGTEETPHVD